MDIAVTEFEPADDRAAEHAHQIVVASFVADIPDFPPPDRRHFMGRLRHPTPGKAVRWALAYLDGVPAGYAEVNLPQLDNLDNATVELHVHPAHRRRGVGRALHRYLARLMRELGRKRLVTVAVGPLPGGIARTDAAAAFATAMGARPVLAEVRRRLDVTALDESALDKLLAEARERSAGYSLVRWCGPTPEADLDDVAYLDGRLTMDAPLGEIEREPAKVDADLIRGAEAARIAWGWRTYHCAARHDASGRIVAWTIVEFSASDPWHALQQITIVDPEHRGHRLGALVKIENLRYVLSREPELRMIDTWNAASNEHMISINEALGYRPVDAWQNWQQKF